MIAFVSDVVPVLTDEVLGPQAHHYVWPDI